MVVCIPSGITEVEMRAVKESCERVNGKEVYLIHEPMAAYWYWYRYYAT
jgi:rod shape-determining protein MreB